MQADNVFMQALQGDQVLHILLVDLVAQTAQVLGRVGGVLVEQLTACIVVVSVG